MTMPTGVTRRGGMFLLRVGIPDDIRHLYPRTAKGALATDRYRASLKTSDRDEAKVRALALRAEFEAEFVAKRKSLAAPPVRPATPLQDIIAKAVYAAEMARDDADRKNKARTVREFSSVHVGDLGSHPGFPEVSRLDPLPANTLAIREVRRGQYLEHVRKALGTGNLKLMIPLAAKAAKSLGLEVDWDSDEGAATLEVCLKQYARAKEDAIKKDQGHVVETPPAPSLPKDAQQGHPEAAGPTQAPPGTPGTCRTIHDLLPLWISTGKRTPEAIYEKELALRLLTESKIPADLATLKGSHGAAFRDWLRDSEARGISQSTGSTRFGSIKTLLNVGAEYDQITANPWTTIRFKVTDAKKRLPFSHEQLKAIHESAQFSAYSPPAGGKGARAIPYWLPLMGLFTGARMGELGQLELDDLKVRDGVHVLDIHKEVKGSKVKTVNGVRQIPVHSELIRLGLLDYARDLRAAGETKLFPSLHRDGTKSPTYICVQAFRAFLNSVGVTQPLATFHSYRHNVSSALENAEVSNVRIHRLIGHADGSIDARYRHMSLEAMSRDLERVQYPFLSLPRVYPLPATKAAAQAEPATA
jgi:integrase